MCRAQQTRSFDHVFDMELDCKLNFVGLKPTSGHTWKQETQSERRVCVCVAIYRCRVCASTAEVKACVFCGAQTVTGLIYFNAGETPVFVLEG